ncbi:MAG: hypothetical protein IJI62_04095 [Lachnospiraceae bacterium]|nr:hypothetical protein [Lachnospiraceae bacterium]
MQSWIEGFQESIDFIEQKLTGDHITEIAAKAALSPFYPTSREDSRLYRR